MVYKVRKIWRRRHQGSAALITTIAVSAILVVLFVGITTIATREIRQSINADNANRALYAAEAGVEDAVRRLADDPRVREENCNELNGGSEVPVTSSGSNNPDVAWTCRTITTTAAELTGRLDVDESLNLNLARGRETKEEDANYAQPRYMTIEWNNPRDAADSATPVINDKVSSWLPVYNPGVSDPWNGAAALEITSTWLQATGSGDVVQVKTDSINKGNLNGIMPVRTVIASPACVGATCTYSDFSPWNTDGYPSVSTTDVGEVGANTLKSNVTTKCVAGGSNEYSCGMPDLAGTKYDLANLVKTEINDGTTNKFYDGTEGGFDSTTMMLRIRPRYSAASYRIRFFDASGNPVYMPDGNATIDVTARSGNYFRRVLAKKQLTPTIYDGVFDNALFSGSNVCKNMRIYRDYRGAPDYRWDSSSGTKDQNDAAGRNSCANDTNV